MTAPCGCCAGTERVTPQAVENRPGLPALSYRVGIHATFLETMLARLTTITTPAPTDPPPRPLQALSTRASSDPAIAFLDAWATVADVLTFYQERIANEGYLRTATTRRSVLELAKLVDYRLRPGAAASVYLAFTVDDGFSGELPIGTRAQSIPASGELPQFFETSHKLVARDEWNAVKPRLTRPQAITEWNAGWIETIYFAGMATKLKADDAILIVWGDAAGHQRFRRVKKVEVEAAENRTRVTLRLSEDALLDALQYVGNLFDELKGTPPAITGTAFLQASAILNPFSRLKSPPLAAALAADVEHLRRDALDIAAHDPQWGVELAAIAEKVESLGRGFYPAWPVTGAHQNPLRNFNDVLARILAPPARTLTSPEALPTAPKTAFAATADTLPRLVAGQAWTDVYEAWGQTTVQPPTSLEVYAFRTRAALYGHNTGSGPPEVFTISLSEPHPNDYYLDDIAIGSFVTLSPATAIPLKPTPAQDLQLSDGSIVHLTVTAAMVLRLDFESPPFSLVLTPPLTTPGWSAEVVGTLADPVNVKIEYTPPPTPAAGAHIAISGVFHGDYVPREPRHELSLDAVYPHIVAGGWIAIERPQQHARPFHVVDVGEGTRADYGVAVRGTRIRVNRRWTRPGDRFDVIRGTTVYAASEELPLAEEPVTADVAGTTIPVDALYGRLDPGRWLIVAGERTDVSTDGGVRTGELVMLAGVSQDVLKTFDPTAKPPAFVPLPGDTLHSTFQLAKPLSYRYKRDTVTIYANVAKATHGQTVTEVLGNGDASRPLQTFALRRAPLTYVASAATAAGTLSTLVSFVDNVKWQETNSLAALGPTDRAYVTDADDTDHITVTFGDGVHGARLPTGSGNVRAEYRYGIGSAGNVAAERISQLATRPPGAKAVVNPLRASGGANRDERDQARRNTPLAVMALDHLVSERDYADFARTFAGIGKAVAVRLTNGRRLVVHVTIAGVDDVPIDTASDLYRALTLALRRYGDPYQPLQVDPRALKMLVIGGGVRIDPRYQWEPVARAVRAALLSEFGFDHRVLGQSAFQSEAIRTMQGVAGVDYVELDVFDAIAVQPPTQLQLLVQAAAQLRLQTHVAAQPARRTAAGIVPAELVMLPPDLHEAVMLREIP
jgi:predicted phage baseplate assembly protein